MVWAPLSNMPSHLIFSHPISFGPLKSILSSSKQLQINFLVSWGFIQIFVFQALRGFFWKRRKLWVFFGKYWKFIYILSINIHEDAAHPTKWDDQKIPFFVFSIYLFFSIFLFQYFPEFLVFYKKEKTVNPENKLLLLPLMN